MGNLIFNNDLISAPDFIILAISDSYDEVLLLIPLRLLSWPPGLFFVCLKGTPDSTVSNSTNDLHSRTSLFGVPPSFSWAGSVLPSDPVQML